MERLEVHYLANQDKNIYFALLGDFADADAEETPADAPLLEAARLGIEELNQRHSNDAAASVSSVSPAPVMECERREMDGLGTKTRKA